jgi:hypothetical protein
MRHAQVIMKSKERKKYLLAIVWYTFKRKEECIHRLIDINHFKMDFNSDANDI